MMLRNEIRNLIRRDIKEQLCDPLSGYVNSAAYDFYMWLSVFKYFIEASLVSSHNKMERASEAKASNISKRVDASK